MTSKQAALEYLKQQYPNWVLGGNMNRLEVFIDGERLDLEVGGDRNIDAVNITGRIEYHTHAQNFGSTALR